LDELDTEECLSHQQFHSFVVPKPMILPRMMARPNEKFSLEKGTLTDADKEKVTLVSKACDASCATRRLPPMRYQRHDCNTTYKSSLLSYSKFPEYSRTTQQSCWADTDPSSRPTCMQAVPPLMHRRDIFTRVSNSR
jgi:hypothetical protein